MSSKITIFACLKFARAKRSLLPPGFSTTVTPGLSMSAIVWNFATFSHFVIGALPLTMYGAVKNARFWRSSVTEMPPTAMSHCSTNVSMSVAHGALTNCTLTPSAFAIASTRSTSMPS